MDFTKDIYINKDTIYENQEIVILYKGFLFSNNLAKDVYISYGYGDSWEHQAEIKMKPSTFGYLATINVESNTNLQFCFRDDEGNWDNNKSNNYILPIQEEEEVLSFKTLVDTTKDIEFEFIGNDDEKEKEEVFEPEVVNSNPVEFYSTENLEDINKQAIPNDTVVNQVNLENETIKVQEAVIKPEEHVATPVEEFSKLTERVKAESVKAFDDDKITTGSLYVNSIVKDIVEEESKEDEKSLIETPIVTPTEKVASFFDVLFKSAKNAFGKFVKLIKTSLNFNDEEN